ncbi:hypothetical protein M422DRAFT_195133, partial [Sphaerobolus stellatus SS14]
KILRVMEKGWAPGTQSTYGSGLLLFHVFCDEQNISEATRCPVNPTLLLAFVAAYSGYYSRSTISNSLHGVHAWHLLHRVNWVPFKDELAAVLTGATRLAPTGSKRALREPWTTDMLTRVCQVLDLNSHFNIAWYTVLTTIFWSMAQLGEFLVQGLNGFKEDKHITRAGVRIEKNEGSQVMVFTLPWTKAAPRGERVFWSRVNPARNRYLRVVDARDSSERKASLLRVHGHGLCISSVLKYLLRGLSFEQAKSMGRWNSDSFALYLHQHPVVLAPYIQRVLL